MIMRGMAVCGDRTCDKRATRTHHGVALVTGCAVLFTQAPPGEVQSREAQGQSGSGHWQPGT